MADTYYDSQLTAAQIEAALSTINNVLSSSNNGKVLCIENGTIVAKSVEDWIGQYMLIEKDITDYGTYYAEDDNALGYNVVNVYKPIGYIEITKEPTKTLYKDGDAIDFTGLEVTAYGVDGEIWSHQVYAPSGIVPTEDLTFPVTIAHYEE